jgi:hypothetical protein
MKGIAILLMLVILLAAAGSAMTQSSASFALSWQTIASGGERSTSSSYRVNGTIGQNLASPPSSASASYAIRSGFWPGVRARDETGTWQLFLPVVLRGQ